MKNKIRDGFLGLLFTGIWLVGIDLYYPLPAKVEFGIASWLILFSLLVSMLVLAATLFMKSVRERVFPWIEAKLSQKKIYTGSLVFFGLVLYESFQDLLFLKADISGVHYLGYREFLTDHYSLLLLVLAASLGFVCLLVGYQAQENWTWIKKHLTKRWMAAFGATLGVLLIINYSGRGMRFNAQDGSFFQAANAPLPGIQVILLLAAFLVIWLAARRLSARFEFLNRPAIRESLILLGIWTGAFFLWTQTPTSPNYFIDIQRPPNESLYPASDALYYDTGAQRVLAGEGFDKEFFPRHPLYSQALALFHLIAGEDYQAVAWTQIALLSFLPVLLYGLGALVHGRLSGVLAALLFVFRERNAVFLSEHITVANVKLLMTEPLTLLCLILLLYAFLLWIKSQGRALHLAALLGGALGLSLLINLEMIIFIPVILIMALIYLWKSKKAWFTGMLLSAVVCLAVIFPWMYRNKVVLGSYALDYQFQYQERIKDLWDIFLPDQVNAAPIDHIPGGAGISPVGWPAPANQGNQEIGSYFQAAAGNDGGGGFLDHFFNNLLQTVSYLPSNHQPLLTAASVLDLFSLDENAPDMEGDSFTEKYLERYIKSLPYWSLDWKGTLEARSFLPLAVSLGVIALGFSVLDDFGTRSAILLLAMLLTYAAALGYLGYSGGRFIALIDWIPLLFYSIGLAALLEGLAGGRLPDGARIAQEIHASREGSRAGAAARTGWGAVFGLLSFLIGSSLYVVDQMIPPRYTDQALGEAISRLDSFPEDSQRIAEILNDQGVEMEVLYGRALYPKFYKAGVRMEDDRKGTIPDYSGKRTEFYLVGMGNGWAALPGNTGKAYFPHLADVIVLGSRQPAVWEDGQRVSGEYLKAELIYILPAPGEGGDPLLLNCSGDSCAGE